MSTRPTPSPSGGREPRPRLLRHTVMAVVVAAYLAAAAIVLVVPHVTSRPRWLTLHLLGLGAATNAVLVWSRHFAQAVLHDRPAGERAAAVRLVVLNVGVVGVLVGVVEGARGVAAAAATVVVVVVVAHAAALLAMWRRRRGPAQLRPVVWFYVAAAASLVVGGVLGGIVASGAVADDSVTEQRLHLAHAQLNLLGWIGLAVIGTQVVLWPTVLRTRMSDRAPVVAPLTLAGCATGLAVLTAGTLVGTRPAAVGGVALYTCAAAAGLDPLLRTLRGRAPRSLPAWLLAASTGWLLVGLVVDTVQLARGLGVDAVLHPLVPLFGVGLVAQALVGALSFLLPVTIGGGPAGNRRLAAVLERWGPARAVVANAGLVLVVLPLPRVWQDAGWAAVVAGLGSFVPLLAVGLLRRG